MKKMTMKESFRNMHTMTKNMPKTINEAVYFEGDDESQFDDMPQEPEVEPAMEPEVGPEEMGGEESMPSAHAGVTNVSPEMQKEVAHFVDDIRKKSLLGMAKLADYPNSAEYEQMKKLWQLCDKKPEQKQATL